MRNRITNDRLVHLSCINIENKIVKTLDSDDFVERFSNNHKNRKIILF